MKDKISKGLSQEGRKANCQLHEHKEQTKEQKDKNNAVGCFLPASSDLLLRISNVKIYNLARLRLSFKNKKNMAVRCQKTCFYVRKRHHY